ncbi:MAG: hypothetical protein JWQ43_2260 [Glaciihabitans sp.]|nr:hypothetical protein [Glaciihabitans sp.]
MIEALAPAMLLPATAAACCTVVDPHRASARVWVPAATMLAAMVDLGMRAQLVGGIGWMFLLVIAAAIAVLPDQAAGRAVAGEGRGIRPMHLHRSLSALVMAGLVAMGSHQPIKVAAVHGYGHGGGGGGGATMATVMIIGCVLVCLFGAAITTRERRRCKAAAFEALAMSLSLMVMAAMHLA